MRWEKSLTCVVSWKLRESSISSSKVWWSTVQMRLRIENMKPTGDHWLWPDVWERRELTPLVEMRTFEECGTMMLPSQTIYTQISGFYFLCYFFLFFFFYSKLPLILWTRKKGADRELL